MKSFVKIPKEKALSLAQQTIANITKYREDIYNRAQERIKTDYKNNFWNKLLKKTEPTEKELKHLGWADHDICYSEWYADNAFQLAKSVINISGQLKEKNEISFTIEDFEKLVSWGSN